MKEVYIVEKGDASIDETSNLKRLLGARVLSVNGIVVGRVREVRIDPGKLSLEGIFVSRGIFQPALYIGASYFERASNDAVILNIDPFVLLKGKGVVSSDGKRIGRIKDLIRDDFSNNVKEIIVGKLFGKDFKIPYENVKLTGKSTILKINYDATKKYLKQGS